MLDAPLGFLTRSINDLSFIKPSLIKITDILGREVEQNKINDNKILLYIYDDGSVKRKFNVSTP